MNELEIKSVRMEEAFAEQEKLLEKVEVSLWELMEKNQKKLIY